MISTTAWWVIQAAMLVGIMWSAIATVKEHT